MKDTKKVALNLKVPIEAHTDLKVFAAKKPGVKLIPFAENVLVEASKDSELLERAAENSKK